MNTIAYDTFLEIIVYLEPPDLSQVASVCKLWLKIVKTKAIIDKCHNINKLLLGFSVTADWNSPAVLAARSRSHIYPGLEKQLDFYHCLARAIKRQHLMAARYFLKKAETTSLCVDEYATLFDLLADHWHPGIFHALVEKFIHIFPQYYTVDLFIKYNSLPYQPLLEGLPKPNPMIHMYLPTTRHHLYDPPPNVAILTPRDGLLAGYRKYVNNNSYEADDGISSELWILMITKVKRH